MVESQPFPYLEEVENGLAHAAEVQDKERKYNGKDLQTKDKSPEAVLNAASKTTPQYDLEYEHFEKDTIGATKVGIDMELGIIDVINNQELLGRYTIAGMLENEQGEVEIMFAGLEYSNKSVISQKDNEINYNPDLAVAYEAIDHFLELGMDRPTEEISLYPEEQQNSIKICDPPEIRQKITAIDQFMQNLDQDNLNGLQDFEQTGSATITGQDHYGAARGFTAARQARRDFRRLLMNGIIDYNIQNLNENGDSQEIDFKIEQRFLNGEDEVNENVKSISDFGLDDQENLEDLTEERL